MLMGIATTLFNGCKKEDKAPEVVTPAPTKTELLTGKNWRMTALTVNPGIDVSGTIITDWYSQLQSCEQDDLVKFNTNGSYTDDEGVTKCNSSDPQTSTGTWVFNTNQTIITQDGTDSYTITELTSTTLKMSIVINEDNGSGPLNYTYAATFTAQ